MRKQSSRRNVNTIRLRLHKQYYFAESHNIIVSFFVQFTKKEKEISCTPENTLRKHL